jgi:F-type H+-transporting ATPase subunit delta
MSVNLIADRYARALNESVSDSRELEVVLSDIDGFRRAYEENAELRSTLNNPAIPPHTREAILDRVLDALDPGPVARNAMKTLFLRRRITLIPQVVLLFGRMVDERLNRVTAKVTTAVELTSEETQRVREGLTAFSGKTVTLELDRDPDVLGGVIAQLGSTVIDGSLRARLHQLKQALLVEEK